MVSETADNTTIWRYVGLMISRSFFIRSGLPTDVPPNFKTLNDKYEVFIAALSSSVFDLVKEEIKVKFTAISLSVYPLNSIEDGANLNCWLLKYFVFLGRGVVLKQYVLLLYAKLINKPVCSSISKPKLPVWMLCF